MGQVKSNLTTTFRSTFTAATEILVVASTLTADTAKFAANSVGSIPGVIKSTASIPFSTAEGYIMDDQKISREEAHAKAFKYVNQPLSNTITEASFETGKLVSQLLREEPAS